jgi:hypothetical protein
VRRPSIHGAFFMGICSVIDHLYLFSTSDRERTAALDTPKEPKMVSSRERKGRRGKEGLSFSFLFLNHDISEN